MGKIDNVKVMLLKGEAGNNIQSITKIDTQGATDTYAITLTDGAVFTFTVTNGANPTSVVLVSQSGSVSTYRMYLSNGDYFDFDISASADANLADVETTNIASKSYNAGEYLLYDSQFYKVTTAIAQGGTLVVDSNIVQTKVGTELKMLGVPNIITNLQD